MARSVLEPGTRASPADSKLERPELVSFSFTSELFRSASASRDFLTISTGSEAGRSGISKYVDTLFLCCFNLCCCCCIGDGLDKTAGALGSGGTGGGAVNDEEPNASSSSGSNRGTGFLLTKLARFCAFGIAVLLLGEPLGVPTSGIPGADTERTCVPVSFASASSTPCACVPTPTPASIAASFAPRFANCSGVTLPVNVFALARFGFRGGRTGVVVGDGIVAAADGEGGDCDGVVDTAASVEKSTDFT